MTRESKLDDYGIRRQFSELASILDEQVTVYLIGGGALTLEELKPATKDIDLIVRETAELDRLYAALESEGYAVPDEIDQEYEELEAAFILQNGKRRFDVFDEQVAGVLKLSPGMIDRSEHLFDEGPLTVQRVSLEDIFLFKAVANRDDDVDDMVTLAQAGVDDETVLDEIDTQLSILADDGFVRSMKYKMERLADEGFDLDIQDEIEALHEQSSSADDVRQCIRTLAETEYTDDLYDGVPEWRIEQELGADTTRRGIEWLKRIDEVERNGDDTLTLPTD
ncbi:DUF6036 family nucleotidyltransferase [Halolamina rubra]|uniref:DUF6036 family nucleotidyltransferase n=1 Tax=Halolamina rubra TaxID=1380430 RepID=UPI000678E118|nr:DUF6036 family nucleotidyltransferase [Halolamina rubra]